MARETRHGHRDAPRRDRDRKHASERSSGHVFMHAVSDRYADHLRHAMRSWSRSRSRGKKRGQDRYRARCRDSRDVVRIHVRDSRNGGNTRSVDASGRGRDRRQEKKYQPVNGRNGAVHNGRSFKDHARGRDRERSRDRDHGRSDSRDSDSRNSGSSSEYSSSSQSGSSGGKDKIVHFSWKRGLLLNSRYSVEKQLGDGTFGRVLMAHDQCEHCTVAIKVIRDVKRYQENAKIECQLLEDVRRADPQGSHSRSAVLFDSFKHERHFCMVFEVLGASLYDFLKKNNYRGYWLQDIQSYARQSLEGLSFLHERLKMTHTDLKPENILLKSTESARPSSFPRESFQAKRSRSRSRSSKQYMRPASDEIKLIDFGNATYEDAHHSSIINTRQYRAPEVYLGLNWNERSDIWSIGCILMELYMGELLFNTHDDLEHLVLMEHVVELLPHRLLASTPKDARDKYLMQKSDSHGTLKWELNRPALSTPSVRKVRKTDKLQDLVTAHHRQFADFAGFLLTVDPARRPSAAKALEHPFLARHWDD